MGSRVKRVFVIALSSLISLAIVGVGIFAVVNRQAIVDHLAAQQFEPTPELILVTERLDLTDAGLRIFWASHPTLDASQQFNEQCSRVEHTEEGHVLGCYVSGHIHLFEISDERLNGIIEVTAAHELLHAAFGRMADLERDALAKKLNALYSELVLEDSILEQRMSVYSGLSKIAFANELHSVFGTEVRELPVWLEDHYSTWFHDRQVILDFFDDYHALFTELRQRADELQNAMADLRADVELRSEQYDTAVEQFNSDWEEFLARNRNAEFAEIPDEFFRLREEFEVRRETLRYEMESLNTDIARYEEMRNELLELSELNHELEQQLDSELAPPAPAPADDA